MNATEQTSTDPVLQAITRAAVEATAASQGWLLGRDDSRLRVMAAVGEHAGQLLTLSVACDTGTAGFVVQSGQPLALGGSGDDRRLSEGVPAALGQRPSSVLCVPCGTEEGVVGALELIDKRDRGRFSLDDVELAALLGGIAGAALDASGVVKDVPAPRELLAELRELAAIEPERYQLMASVISALLASG